MNKRDCDLKKIKNIIIGDLDNLIWEVGENVAFATPEYFSKRLEKLRDSLLWSVDEHMDSSKLSSGQVPTNAMEDVEAADEEESETCRNSGTCGQVGCGKYRNDMIYNCIFTLTDINRYRACPIYTVVLVPPLDSPLRLPFTDPHKPPKPFYGMERENGVCCKNCFCSHYNRDRGQNCTMLLPFPKTIKTCRGYIPVTSYTIDSNLFSDVIKDVRKRYEEAVFKHPAWPEDLMHQAGILCEEAGETMKEAFDLIYTKDKGSIDRLKHEASQAAAMGIRILYELEKGERDAKEKSCREDKNG